MLNIGLMKSPMNWFLVGFVLILLSLASHAIFGEDK